jgi:hypothetical protein
VGGGVHGLDPKGEGHGGLDKKSPENVIGATDGAFGFPVLSRSMRAGKSKRDAVGGEVGSQGVVKKFPPIVTLEAPGGGVILGAYIGKKAL